jgi:hypothetical protein
MSEFSLRYGKCQHILIVQATDWTHTFSCNRFVSCATVVSSKYRVNQERCSSSNKMLDGNKYSVNNLHHKLVIMCCQQWLLPESLFDRMAYWLEQCMFIMRIFYCIGSVVQVQHFFHKKFSCKEILQFFETLWFTVKAHFYLHIYVNKKNAEILAIENHNT